jgi:trimethylamine--corrinoid protein Co-methyltransferase
MKLETMKVLSDREIEKIHDATVEILCGCGVRVCNERMLSFLRGKGLKVDKTSQTVFFTRAALEDALGAIPQTFEVFDREGKFAFVLGDGDSKIAAGHNAIFWTDSETGKTRYSTKKDVETFARICEDLPAIHMIGIPVMPQDVEDPGTTLLHGVRAVVENSRKPVFFSTDNERINNTVIEMLRAAFNGNMKERAYGISQLSPTSPLYWEERVVNAIMDTVPAGVPLAILPEPNAGISAPYTLAGLLTVNNAECLSGLAMIQMLRPGAKVMYANSWTFLDMRTAAALVSSTETNPCRVAGGQLARFYKVPSHTTAPNSDNHAHDEQSAWEKTFSMFCSVASGHDLVVNCGMFGAGMTCSHEQLIMDEEISAMCKRIARGIDVSDDSIALSLIKEIGPGSAGEKYLTADHTLRWLRTEEFLPPRVSVRSSYAVWQSQGGRNTYALSRERAKKYFDAKPVPFDGKRAAKLREIVDSFTF